MGLIGKNKPWHVGRDRAKIDFSFQPDSTNNPTGLKGNGVESVVRDAAGAYTVTFQDVFGQLDCVVGSVREANAVAYIVTFGEYNATAKTLVVQVSDDAGTGTDLTLDDDNVVNVSVTVRDGVEEGYR